MTERPAITAGVTLSLISTLLVMLRSLGVISMTDAQLADVLAFVGIAGPLVMSLWITIMAWRAGRNPLGMTTGPMQQLVPMPPPSVADAATSGQKIISTAPSWRQHIPMPPPPFKANGPRD